MSKHNRERRKWKCAKCGMRMHRELASPAARTFADAVRGKRADPRMVHVCGQCKTCHYEEGEGLRECTPAEVLELHVEVPKVMAQIERAVFAPTSVPTGTLVIGKE